MTGADLPRLSDLELLQLSELLARYASHDLDQFDPWSLKLWWGTAYVEISNALAPGVAEEVYTQIWPPPEPLLRRLAKTQD